jgi:hypothetical protein
MLRIHVGGSLPVIGMAGYSFHFGVNILKNLGLFIVQGLLPVSSMAVMRAIRYREYFQIAAIVFFTGFLAIIFVYGLWKSPRRKIIVAICSLMFCSWFPAILLNSISELYPYNSVLYLGALFGIALEYYWISERSIIFRLSASAVFFAAIITNAVGVNEKTSSMKVLGDRAAAFLPQIIKQARTLPKNYVMYLVNPGRPIFEYSQFSMRGFLVISGCDSLVRFYAKRPDFQYFIGDSAECAENMKDNPGFAFTFDTTTQRIYPIIANSGMDVK